MPYFLFQADAKYTLPFLTVIEMERAFQNEAFVRELKILMTQKACEVHTNGRLASTLVWSILKPEIVMAHCWGGATGYAVFPIISRILQVINQPCLIILGSVVDQLSRRCQKPSGSLFLACLRITSTSSGTSTSTTFTTPWEGFSAKDRKELLSGREDDSTI